LGAIGPAAEAAVPALVLALKDTDRSMGCRTATALGRIGPAAEQAVPALIEALEHPRLRNHAARALGRIGPAAKAAVPALVRALKDNQANVRSNAGSALRGIGPVGVAALNRAQEERAARLRELQGAAVPALIEALKDADPIIRRSAASALAKRRRAAREAVPALVQALKDADQSVAISAGEALSEIGPAASEGIPALVQALKDEDPRVRLGAASALAQMGPAAKEAVPALAHALRDQDQGVRVSAAHALGKIGPAAKAAVPELREALKDADVSVRNAAWQALWWRGPREEADDLLRDLQSPNAGVRQGAARALAEAYRSRSFAPKGMSPRASDRRLAPAARKEAARGLERALRHEDIEVRVIAARALGKRDPRVSLWSQPGVEHVLGIRDDRVGLGWLAAVVVQWLSFVLLSIPAVILMGIAEHRTATRGRASWKLWGIGCTLAVLQYVPLLWLAGNVEAVVVPWFWTLTFPAGLVWVPNAGIVAATIAAPVSGAHLLLRWRSKERAPAGVARGKEEWSRDGRDVVMHLAGRSNERGGSGAAAAEALKKIRGEDEE
jgi:HEAT repeat protein